MTDKFRKAWQDIEEAIGSCCLHKKAAFREISGKGVQQLSLVTTASPDVIRAFIGERNVDESQPNRFAFAHDGIQVDLTTFCDEEDVDKLFVKSFRHTLTIDSVGITRDGQISNMYHGVEDIQNKILRLTDEKSVISEILFRRILQMIYNEGFRLDESIKRKIEAEKFFEKESYRRKFCEVLSASLKAPNTNWERIAELVDVLGGYIGHRKPIVNYTREISEGKNDAYKRTYAFLIFALIKVTSKEIQPLYSGDPAVGYLDSLCNRLGVIVETYSQYKELKEKYGAEFMEILFDMQELWMAMENVPYKRPTERDFDRMALLIADKRFWGSGSQTKAPEQVKPKMKEKPPVIEAEKGPEMGTKLSLEGSFDFNRVMNGGYNEADYEGPTEGPVKDDYVHEEEREEQNADNVSSSDGLDIFDSAIADENSFDETKDGFDESGLEEYESMGRKKVEPQAPVLKHKQSDSILGRNKGHKMIVGK